MDILDQLRHLRSFWFCDTNVSREHFVRDVDQLLSQERARPDTDLWLKRILDEYVDDYSKEACDKCEGCGPIGMCSFHSLLSLLNRGTFLDEAHQRLAARASSGPQEKEICICAAVQFADGRIVRGHRHDSCFRTAEGWTPKPDKHGHVQGFITSCNRFVDRTEGARLQNAAGIESAHYHGPVNEELFSEDLYFDSHDHAAWNKPYTEEQTVYRVSLRCPEPSPAGAGMSQILKVFSDIDALGPHDANTRRETWWVILDCLHWYHWTGDAAPNLSGEFPCPSCAPMPSIKTKPQ